MPRQITLAIAGDLMLGRLVYQAIVARGFDYPWGTILPLLREADVCLSNLECALTTVMQHEPGDHQKAYYFRADPSAVATLQAGGIRCVSLANNHAYDFGAAGLTETMAVLDRAAIAHAGAGDTLTAAQEPARLTVNGIRISVIACADHPLSWAATPSSPGINYFPISLAAEHFSTIERALAAARQETDLVVFSMHSGATMPSRPSETFRAFARRVVAAGADIFWGHGAHLVQGLEVYQGKIILYDTGNFVDDYVPAQC